MKNALSLWTLTVETMRQRPAPRKPQLRILLPTCWMAGVPPPCDMLPFGMPDGRLRPNRVCQWRCPLFGSAQRHPFHTRASAPFVRFSPPSLLTQPQPCAAVPPATAATPHPSRRWDMAEACPGEGLWAGHSFLVLRHAVPPAPPPTAPAAPHTPAATATGGGVGSRSRHAQGDALAPPSALPGVWCRRGVGPTGGPADGVGSRAALLEEGGGGLAPERPPPLSPIRPWRAR